MVGVFSGEYNPPIAPPYIQRLAFTWYNSFYGSKWDTLFSIKGMIKSPVEIGSAIVIFSQPRLARGVLAFGSKNTISDKKNELNHNAEKKDLMVQL